MNTHHQRVLDELKAVGVTRYGLMKGESRSLPPIIHDDEHIGGVVYGQIGSGSSAMLIATNRRVIFLDQRPLFLTTDELTYDVVSGVKSSTAGPFTSVTLHTRVNEYHFRYVNNKCAKIFIKFIENKRLEKGAYDTASSRHMESAEPAFNNVADENALLFLKEHDTAVLSTVDRTGNVHGAVIYYVVDEKNLIYILTKSDTSKGRNVYAHNQVALTVHEPGTLKTLQIKGIADIEINQQVKEAVFSRIVKPRMYKDESHLPPVTKLQSGSFIVIRIHAEDLKYHDYAK